MSPRHAAWLAAGAWLLMRGSTAHAAPETAATQNCSSRHATAIGQVACELASGMPKADAPIVVLAVAVETPLRAERLDELAARLASLVAGELGPEARAAGGPVSFRDLTRQVAPGKRVVVLRPRLESDRFSAVADELSSVPKFWERLRGVTPGSLAHAFATRPLDAELRSFLPPVPLVLSRVDKSAPLDEPSVAVACGDVDADGTLEIVSVGRQRIQLGRLKDQRFIAERAVPWSSLSEIAKSPLREPIASAVLRSPGSLEVGLSDRAAAIRFDAELKPVARYANRIPWPGAGCATVNAVALKGNRARCEGPVDTTPLLPGEGIDAIAGMRSTHRDGAVREVFARRRQLDGIVELGLGSRWIPLPEPAGAQIALGDLDGDGHPELISTNDGLDPSLDFVRVATVQEAGTLREAFRLPVPAGVHALAICPAASGSLSPIVLATGEGLWVLR